MRRLQCPPSVAAPGRSREIWMCDPADMRCRRSPATRAGRSTSLGAKGNESRGERQRVSAREAPGSCPGPQCAEGEGFEPPVPLLTQRFSRPPPSAARSALPTSRCYLMWHAPVSSGAPPSQIIRSLAPLSVPAQPEEVPGLLVCGRLRRLVQQAARNRRGEGWPQRHARHEHRLQSVVDIPT